MNTCQSLFHQDWQHLHDPHVRALAWMLTSPGMLAKNSPRWQQKIAQIRLPDQIVLRTWLSQVDRQPAGLHQALALQRYRRLGHYAENLLAFYLQHEGILYAHGLQVHAEQAATVGEFDFLLYEPGGLLHWEIATKFYLLESGDHAGQTPDLYDFLGPNLADTLGAKMEKIFRQQLALSRHAAAQRVLPQKVIGAEALIKGWLFYPEGAMAKTVVEGLATDHCRGYWWTRDDLGHLAIPYALILERLQWLAPAQTWPDLVLEKGDLLEALNRHFQNDSSPVMVAIMRRNGDVMQEFCRGMVVPNDWLSRARTKLRQSPSSDWPAADGGAKTL